MVDWSNYPRDGIEAISQRIDNGVDYIRFRSVCNLWRTAAPKKPQFPWLVARHTGDDYETRLGFYDFPNPNYSKPLLLDEIDKDKRICGCSRGWICILDSAPSISLNNPFTGTRIQLPSFADLLPGSSDRPRIAKVDGGFLISDKKRGLRTLGNMLAKKVILSSDPIGSPNECVVMGLVHMAKDYLSCYRGLIVGFYASLPNDVDGFTDILFYKGIFYVVSGMRLFVCNTADNAKITEISPADPSLSYGWDSPSDPPLGYRQYPLSFEKRVPMNYLVESFGDLLLVTTRRQSPMYSCEVYGIDLSSGFTKLMKHKNLNVCQIAFTQLYLLIVGELILILDHSIPDGVAKYMFLIWK